MIHSGPVYELQIGAAHTILAPGLQGRILTSEVGGVQTGFVNLEAIAAGEVSDQFNNFGGQDRFWIGPEPGLYFEPPDRIERTAWRVPRVLNEGSWEVVETSLERVILKREMELVNDLGTQFKVLVQRELGQISREDLSRELGVDVDDAHGSVAFSGSYSRNQLINVGEAWTRDTGLLNVWILGQFNAGPNTVVIAPFRGNDELDDSAVASTADAADLEAKAGPEFNDEYFGKVSRDTPDRLQVSGNAVIFRADAKREGKFGLGPLRSTGVAGSFDADANLLIVVKFSVHPDQSYASFRWDKDPRGPYGGDVFQAYNADSTAKAADSFYEMESVSPCRELGRGDRVVHRHATFCFQGPRPALDRIAREVLGVSLDAALGALPRS